MGKKESNENKKEGRKGKPQNHISVTAISDQSAAAHNSLSSQKTTDLSPPSPTKAPPHTTPSSVKTNRHHHRLTAVEATTTAPSSLHWRPSSTPLSLSRWFSLYISSLHFEKKKISMDEDDMKW